MEPKKNNIIKTSKHSTHIVIVDKFEDNPQLEGKEMEFHKKPGPTRPPRPNNPPIWFQNFVENQFKPAINSIKNRLDNVEDILKRNNLR